MNLARWSGTFFFGLFPYVLLPCPCPWDPPCALDVLFREQGRVGPQGIPKPWVLSTDRKGADLLVTLTLFGFASDWSAAATHALVATLSHRVDWGGVRPDLYLPRGVVDHVVVNGSEGVAVGPDSGSVSLRFLTPMNGEGDNPLERPDTILARLVRRVRGLALWHDADVGEDWERVGLALRDASYDTGFLNAGRAARRSGRASQRFAVDTVSGTVGITALDPALKPLAALGAVTHVGKGAAEGFGRYCLE